MTCAVSPGEADARELAAWLRLALTPGLGHATKRQLLSTFGPPAHLYDRAPHTWQAVLSPGQAAALGKMPEGFEALWERTERWLADDPDQRALLTLADPRYPAALLETDDPPLVLHAMGAALAAWPPPGMHGTAAWPTAIAIVGSRHPTPQGALNARQFARAFAAARWGVVSGLALGIDAAAHEGALDGALAEQPDAAWATTAVVGTGLDQVYPARHQALAHRIARHGVILGEYPLGTPPLPPHFPRRNRIISALGRGTLVVEAALASGSLITARCALEQGREVFAIPGPIHSPQSRGCHALIKQGAKLVETAQDVFEELGAWTRGSPAATAPSVHAPEGECAPSTPPAGTQAQAILQALGFGPRGLDALVTDTGLDAASLQGQLLELELAGQVFRLPGGLFQRRIVV